MRTLTVLATALLAAACSSPGAPGPSGAAPTAAALSGPSSAAGSGAGGPAGSTPATRTPTGTTPTRATPTPRPVTVDAPCPYAGAQVVADIVGQRIARTTVTRTRPHPGCAFYRPNGEQAAEVAVSVLASPAAARAQAVRVPGTAANPVDQVGDGGAVAVTGTGAVLAVAEGAALVVVRINQTSSLEATEIARLVVARI